MDQLIAFAAEVQAVLWVRALAVVLVSMLLAKLVDLLTSTILASMSRLADRVTWLESRTLPLFDNLSKIVIFGLAIYFFLIAWELDLSAWLASAGIMGIAVGFAAKDTLANLFGGLFVIMDAPYKLGDFINLDSGERGRVIKIGLHSSA